MTDPLSTYLTDHLAGAEFAISLLEELGGQSWDPDVAKVASEILKEVRADRLVLNQLADRFVSEPSKLKSAAGWLVEKASRFKLTISEAIGRFEAVETLALGVQGKLALWNALKVLQGTDDRLKDVPLDNLAARAVAQHRDLEAMRLRLAPMALGKAANEELRGR